MTLHCSPRMRMRMRVRDRARIYIIILLTFNRLMNSVSRNRHFWLDSPRLCEPCAQTPTIHCQFSSTPYPHDSVYEYVYVYTYTDSLWFDGDFLTVRLRVNISSEARSAQF